MKFQRLKRYRALTLTELLTAAVILTLVVLAVTKCRYHSTLDARRARMQMTSARIGLTLCESWRGVKGDIAYDPSTHLGAELKFTSTTGPKEPADFTKLASYSITSDDLTCYVTLSWKDVTSGLRALNVTVAWTQQNLAAPGLKDTDKTFELTTYTTI